MSVSQLPEKAINMSAVTFLNNIRRVYRDNLEMDARDLAILVNLNQILESDMLAIKKILYCQSIDERVAIHLLINFRDFYQGERCGKKPVLMLKKMAEQKLNDKDKEKAMGFLSGFIEKLYDKYNPPLQFCGSMKGF